MNPVFDVEYFRGIAASMLTEPATWQWIGEHMSQRQFGITERRAIELASKFGGEARAMPIADASSEMDHADR